MCASRTLWAMDESREPVDARRESACIRAARWQLPRATPRLKGLPKSELVVYRLVKEEKTDQFRALLKEL